MIAFSSILLAIDEPNLSSYSKDCLLVCHTISSALFIVEAVIKIIVFNFAFLKNPF